LESSAKREQVKRFLNDEIKKRTQAKENLKRELEKAKSQTGVNPVKTNYTIVTNYAWDQTDELVKIYLEPEKECVLDSSTIALTFPNSKSFQIIYGKYKLSVNKLFDAIDEGKSEYKVTKSHKLIVNLKKASKKNWPSLNEKASSLKLKEAIEEDKADSEEDASAGLMKLMKKMYDEGDDDMKRTIAKSWHDSRQKNASGESGIDMPPF